LNIALHICCGPCSIHPIEELRTAGHTIAGFFSNSNIHPYSEYLKRKGEVEKYSKSVKLNVIYDAYNIEEFIQNIAYNEDPMQRCPICWWIRIRNTAKFAKENGFDAFTTTLLGSPYQDHEVITKICQEVAVNAEIGFHYVDFRTGFKAGYDKAKSIGMYCQNYCGCIFSEKERLEKKGKKKNPSS